MIRNTFFFFNPSCLYYTYIYLYMRTLHRHTKEAKVCYALRPHHYCDSPLAFVQQLDSMSDSEHPGAGGTDSGGEQHWQMVPSRRRTRQAESATTWQKPSLPEPVPETPKPVIPFAVPHPNDRIFHKARDIVIAHNRKSFANYTDPLYIYAFERVSTAYAGQKSEVDLALVYRRTGLRIPFKLIPKPSNAKAEVLECEVKGGWQPFAKWLDSLKPPPGSEVAAQRGLHLQQQWWDKNGRHFRLMDLPAELRITVLEHAIGPVIYPRRDQHLSYGIGSESATYFDSLASSITIDHTKPHTARPNVDFIFSCRKLYEEVKLHFHYSTAKAFEDPRDLASYIRRLPSAPGALKRLRHLDLDLEMRNYILFFDVQAAPFNYTAYQTQLVHYRIQGDAKVLRDLPFLQSLRLHFRSTISAADDSAWQYTGTFNGHEWYCDFRGMRDREGFATPCQKILVDWILTYAKDYIQHTPQVQLTGYLKDSTKEKWERIPADERAGVQHDMEEGKRAVQTWPTDDLPPRCHCSSPCAFYKYNTVVEHRECRYLPNLPQRYADKLISGYVFDFAD